MLGRGVAPAQAVAVDYDDAAHDPPVIQPRLVPGLLKVRPKQVHLLLTQPELPRHATL
jgi:hypothetical protein